MKYKQKYGKQGNLTTYCSDTETPYITRTQQNDGKNAVPSVSPRNVNYFSRNYCGITLISIAAKIYNIFYSNLCKQKIKKFFGRIKMDFGETDLVLTRF